MMPTITKGELFVVGSGDPVMKSGAARRNV